mmetsp:Transcript_23290/g.66240  ORF Transcript_23290/g.66240 Transcript_23290/m.66240 type:complete len:362 (-) Transcript_23290:222-1307(-)
MGNASSGLRADSSETSASSEAEHASASENKEDGHKKEAVHQCMACSAVLEADHTGIICVQSHHICAPEGCASNFVTHVISEGSLGVPVKCMDCHMDVIPNTFERNCTEPQLANYRDMCVRVGAEREGESLYPCRFCKCQVLLVDSPGDLFFECPNDECLEVYCMVCNERCRAAEAREPHVMECPPLGRLKSAVEKVVADGGARSCPGCGHTGRKDAACTHITCPVCQTRWCYVCGLERDRAHGGESRHNSGWEADARRCPMYLQNIHSKNPEWPTGAGAAVDHFHHRQILWSLREQIMEVGEIGAPQMPRVWGFLWRHEVPPETKLEHGIPIMRRLLSKFPHVTDGLTVDEILSATPPRDY